MHTHSDRASKEYAGINKSASEHIEDAKNYNLRGRSVRKSDYASVSTCSPKKVCGTGNSGSWDSALWLLLGSAVAAVAVYWFCLRATPFCDTDPAFSGNRCSLTQDQCRPCPLFAECASGSMVRILF